MIIKRKPSQILQPEPQARANTDARLDDDTAWLDDIPELAAINPDDLGLDEESQPMDPTALPYDARGELRQEQRRRSYRRVEDMALITKAHEEANAIREKAYIEGFEQGLQDAAQQLVLLQQKMDELLAGKEDALASVADQITPIAVAIAEKIIHAEVRADDSVLKGLLRHTLRQMDRNAKSVIIKVNPNDLVRVRELLRDDPVPGLKAEMIILDEPTVDQGSCIVETSSGVIDATFSTQMEILRRLLGLTGGER